MTRGDTAADPSRLAGFLAVVSVLFCCAVFTLTPISSNDTFWHLACGRRIIETGTVSRTDEFTFTCAGNAWVNHEYLADVLFSLVEQGTGLSGVVVLCGSVVLAAALLLWRTAVLSTRTALVTFPLLLAVALYGIVPRLMARPHVFSFAFVAFFCLVLHDLERGRRRLIWGVPPVLLLWAQLHGGYLLGFAFLGLICVRLFVERPKRKHAVLLAASTLVLLIGPLLIGPYGIETFIFPWRLLGSPSFMQSISEWQSPLGGSALARPFNHYAGMAMVCAGVAASYSLWRRKEGSLTELLWLLLLTAMALKMRRALAYPVLVATVPLTRFLPRLLRESSAPSWLGVAPAPIALAFLLWGIPTGPGRYQEVRLGLGANVPERAVDFMERHEVKGNVYNSYTLGAYITYRLWPHVRTAIDSRNLVYSEGFFNNYQRSLRQATSFREELLNRADIALFASPQLPDATPPILAALREAPEWSLVYFDDTAFLFLRTEKKKAIRAYRRLRPDCLAFEAQHAAEALEEARRAAEEAPDSALAWIMRGYAAFQLAEQRPAEQDKLLLESRFAFLKALVRPDSGAPPNIYYYLARAEALLGDRETALRYVNMCLARDRDYEPALEFLKGLRGT